VHVRTAAQTHVCVCDCMCTIACLKVSYAACAGVDLHVLYVRCACLPMHTRLHVYMCACVLAHGNIVGEFVLVCAWHLAWQVRVTLLVVHVHARIYARMRIRASGACPNDVAVTAS